ncbi:ectoine utilization protein EutA [Oceanidesulfovibrio marinus]|uniref:Ectoine utilization protein EutA n=1 Tax=Oceanidesulfovibrio marinus TaxID=370038 RepID=A0ABX6NH60_9BACT|nr:ectoine utilization protein EutA [Oceanidesulfovibrio marinus]QJT09974.1 ectoine utilization protein EutA [Oceanidesulfovibrio marinus]
MTGRKNCSGDVPAAKSSVPIAFDDESSFTRLGLILLATDMTTEQDFALMARICGGDRLRLHATRVAYANPVTPENLRAMGPRLGQAAGLLAPVMPLKAVYFSCTSGSAVIGDDVVAAAVQNAMPAADGQPAPKAVTPLTAATAACSALGVSRLCMLTPYTEDSTKAVVGYFVDHGVEASHVSYLGLGDDRDMARITTDSLVQAAKEAVARSAGPAPQALFISCTALRSMQTAAQIEQKIGIPVITSNQAAAWYSFKTAGIDTSAAPFGRLMTKDIP